MTCTVTACPGGTGPDAVRARVWAVRPSASKAIGIERSGSPGSLLPIVIAPEPPSLVARGAELTARPSSTPGGIESGGGGSIVRVGDGVPRDDTSSVSKPVFRTGTSAEAVSPTVLTRDGIELAAEILGCRDIHGRAQRHRGGSRF